MFGSIICRWFQEGIQRMFGNWEVAGKAELLRTLEEWFWMQGGPLFQRQGNASLLTKQSKWRCQDHILLPQNWSVFSKTLFVGVNLFSLYFLFCAGRWNASADSSQAHLHYWLFPVAVLAHGGHPGDGPVEVCQVLLLFLIYLPHTNLSHGGLNAERQQPGEEGLC